MPPNQLVLVDVNSSDNTRDIIDSYQRAHPALVSTIHIDDEISIGDVVRKIYPTLVGDLISLNSGDDTSRPERFQRIVEQIEETGALPGLIFSDGLIVDRDGAHLGLFRTLRKASNPTLIDGAYALSRLMRGNWIFAPSVLIKGDDFYRAAALIEENSPFEDYPMWIQVALKSNFLYVPEPLVCYRRHPGNSSSQRAQKERILNSEIRILSQMSRTRPGLELDIFVGAAKLAMRSCRLGALRLLIEAALLGVSSLTKFSRRVFFSTLVTRIRTSDVQSRKNTHCSPEP